MSVPCVGLDMIKKAALPKIKMQTAGADVASHADTTSAKKVSVGDRTLRTCGVDAMVIAMAMLSDSGHLRLLSITTTLAQLTKAWHASSSRELRDVGGSQAWLLAQVRGAACKQAYIVIGLFLDPDFLQGASFVPTGGMYSLVNCGIEEIAYEDEFAEIAGGFALRLLCSRPKRTLNLTMASLTS